MKHILVFALLVLVCIAPAQALGTKYWDAKVYPGEGSTTQSITILIRMASGEETTGATARYVYVFYDGNAVLKAQASPYVSSTALYTYKWDLSFTVPQTAQCTAYGDHEVVVRLEEVDGSYTEKTVGYEIVSGSPVGEWWKTTSPSFWALLWENCPPAILEGMKGATGEQGPAGADGEVGKTPTIDYDQLGDKIDYPALWDNAPASIKGDTGATGASGKDADPTLTYLSIALSTAAIILVTATIILPKVKALRKR